MRGAMHVPELRLPVVLGVWLLEEEEEEEKQEPMFIYYF